MREQGSMTDLPRLMITCNKSQNYFLYKTYILAVLRKMIRQTNDSHYLIFRHSSLLLLEDSSVPQDHVREQIQTLSQDLLEAYRTSLSGVTR